jgi:dihydrofolate synthase/folylpolyglutamate synthase
MTFTRYEEAVEWITGLIPFGIRPGLARVEAMLEKLDHPERKLKFIHVAGTNGKGSTSACLAAVLQQCGYATGTFNSPYITRYSDRIRVNGEDIPDPVLVEIANRLKPLADELSAGELGSPTMFEITTVLAIEYFARYAWPDVVIMETGLGGLLDSTNVIIPIASVITNVGHDHMDILGDTIGDIARQKAGIIKPGVPVISGVRQPEAIAVLEQAAAAKKSKLYLLGRDFHAELAELSPGRVDFHYGGPFRRLDDLAVSLSGAHQMENAALAVMTLEVLRQYYAFIVEDEDLRAGLQQVRWPGRLEMLPGNPGVLIDGAHNPEGAEALAAAVRDLYGGDKVHLMLGMLSTKNHTDYLWHILPIVDTLIVSQPDFHKAFDAAALAKLAEELKAERGKPGLSIVTEPDWRKALALLRRTAGPRDLAVATGSLYLVSDVRSALMNETIHDKGW